MVQRNKHSEYRTPIAGDFFFISGSYVFQAHFCFVFYLLVIFFQLLNSVSSTKPQKVNRPHGKPKYHDFRLFEFLIRNVWNVAQKIFGFVCFCVGFELRFWLLCPDSIVAGLLLTDIKLSDYYYIIIHQFATQRTWLSSKRNQFYLRIFKEDSDG